MAGQSVICGLVEAAVGRGLEVTYVGLVQEDYQDDGDITFTVPSKEASIRTDTCVYRQKAGGRWSSFKNFVDKIALHEFIRRSPLLDESYDSVFSFDSLARHLALDVRGSRHFTIVGDPASERLRYLENSIANWRKPVYCTALHWFEKRHIAAQIPAATAVGMFGTRHAREWSTYLDRPIFDLRPGLPQRRSSRNSEAKDKLVISFGGTLPATASQLANTPLEREILPALAHSLNEPYTVRIVGRESDVFRQLAARWQCIELQGRVPSFHTELQQADVFILPMKYPVGVRTRLCEATQAGCFCISDPSVLENMPELRNQPFIEFASGGQEYVDVLSRFAARADRQALSREAERFFAAHYAAEPAHAPILDFLCKNNVEPAVA